jgi:hypothetical protein
MADYCEIRADFNDSSIVVYQAYAPIIADAALEAGRFVAPWSSSRMTWIKPSFLWMMERSNWGRKPGQERVLGVRLHRWAWEKALGLAVLTHPEGDSEQWRQQIDQSPVRVQWDPERSLSGTKLDHRSIQVGLARDLADEFCNQWIVDLTDLSPLVNKICRFRDSGELSRAKTLLPRERVYPVSPALAKTLRMHTQGR